MKLKLQIHQMDVTTAYFNAALGDEVIIVIVPPEYEHIVPEVKSICLLKSMYGLKTFSNT